MAAYNIPLRLRDGQRSLIIPRQQIVDIVNSGSKDALWEILKQLTEDDKMHDREWLKMIVNWVPEGGQTLVEMSKWLKLAKRVSDLDDREDGSISLSQWHVDLIWNRLIDKRFKITALEPAFAGFLLELQSVTGKRFENGEPDDEDTE